MKLISKTIKSLMTSEPYYGLYACGLNKRWSTEISTAAVTVEGINNALLVNKEYFESLTPLQQIGVIKHELMHILLFHIANHAEYIAKYPDHHLLNIAMDLQIEGLQRPEHWRPQSLADCYYRDWFPNLPKNAGIKFYWDFLQMLKNKQDNPNSQENQSSNSSDNSSSNSSMNNLSNQYDKLSKDDQESIQNNLRNNDLHQEWKDFDSLPDEVKNLIKNQIEYQMVQVAKSCTNKGSIPGEFASKIDELMRPKPPVFNWKAVFRRMLGVHYDVNQKKTRRKESKRFEDSQGMKLKKKHKILVAVDTSGSVCDQEIADFFTEIRHIWKAGAMVDVIEADSRMSDPYEYKGTIPKSIHGRGGTSFIPAVNYYNEHRKDYTICVYLTDGYGDQDECKPLGQMIWIITSNGNTQSKYPGIKVCIPKQD